jgi:hypothetical protein
VAKTVTMLTQVTLAGDGYVGTAPFWAETLVNTAGLAPGQVTTINGSVTVAVPATALGVLILPTPGSTLVKTYKGIAGDTGIPTDPVGAARFKWTAGQIANFVITTTGIEVLALIWL